MAFLDKNAIFRPYFELEAIARRLSKISPTYETRSVVKILALIFSKQNIFEKIPKNSHNNSFLTMYDTIG